MSNQAIGVSLLVFGLMGIPVAIMSFLKRKQSISVNWFLVLCLSNSLWIVFASVIYLTKNEDIAFILQNTKLAFICTSSILMYIVSLGILKNKRIDRKILVNIFIIPVFTFFLGLTNASHGLLTESVHFSLDDGVRRAYIINGPWFWVHCVFCYLFVFLTAHLIVKQLFRLPGKYRSPALILLFSLIIFVAASIGAIFELFPYALDPAPFAAVIVQIMIYFTLFSPRSVGTLLNSRDAIFEQTSNPLFILSNDREIIDFNVSAGKLAAMLDLEIKKGETYDAFFSRWMELPNIRIFEEDTAIFTMQQENCDIHYQEVSNNLYNRRNEVIGTFIEVKNITPIMTLIHKLQDSAYFDILTGLHNRNYFMRVINEWEHKDVYPLGIVVGDVNGLKKVNDTFGHAKGDLILQLVAGDLSKNMPERALAFRMGGDEFTILVPKSNIRELDKYLQQIESKDYSLVDEDFRDAGISISYVLKTDRQTTILESMHEADVLMYTKKKNRRRE